MSDWGIASLCNQTDNVTVNGKPRSTFAEEIQNMQNKTEAKTCAQVANEFVHWGNRYSLDAWISSFMACSDFPRPKKTKQVWQWRTRRAGIRPDNFKVNWCILAQLMDEKQIIQHCEQMDVDYEKHAGPFEVAE